MKPFSKAAFTAVVTFIAFSLASCVSAQPRKHHHAAPVVKTSGQAYCLAEIMQNEGAPTTAGRVSVGVAVLTRASSTEWGAKGNICALRKPRQFNYLMGKVRKPVAATMAVAKQMIADWKNGKPTIEVDLQRRLKGCAYFYNPKLSKPRWGRTFIDCGHVAGHNFRRDPKTAPVLAYAD